MPAKDVQQFFVMKQDGAMVSGWRLCGTARSRGAAVKIRDGHTTHLNGKPYNVPRIWTEAEYDAWQKGSLLTRNG